VGIGLPNAFNMADKDKFKEAELYDLIYSEEDRTYNINGLNDFPTKAIRSNPETKVITCGMVL
jgi:hypothetical protein